MCVLPRYIICSYILSVVNSYEPFQCSDHLKAATEALATKLLVECSHSRSQTRKTTLHEMKMGQWAERRVGGRSYIEMLQGKLKLNGNLNHSMCS